MSQVADTPRRQRRKMLEYVVWTLLLTAVLALIGYGCWQYTAPVAPNIPLDGLDPDAAAAIRAALDDVRKRPRSDATWGKLGQVLMAHEDFDHPDACFAQAAALNPNEPRWPYYRGFIAVKQKPEQALPFLRRAVALCDKFDPGNDGPRLLLTETLLQVGGDADAEGELNRVLASDPDNARAHFDLGVLAMKRHDDDSAVAHFTVSARSPAARQKSCRALAAIRHGQGKEDQAAALDRQAADPPDDRPWNDRYIEDYMRLEAGRRGRFHEAENLEAVGQLPDALPILLDLARDSSDARAQIAAGIALLKLGRAAEAEGYLRAAIGRGSEQAEANNFLAVALYTEGEQAEQAGADATPKYREALTCAERALQLKPDHVTASQYRGLALEKLGRRHDAIAWLRQAALLRPELAELHLSLADALLADKQRDEAIREYRRAQEVAPDDPRPRAALQQLEAPADPGKEY